MLTDTIYNVILTKENKTIIVNAAYSIESAQTVLKQKENDYMSRPVQEWKTVQATDELIRMESNTGETITLEIKKTHICDTEDASAKWHFDYEQEFPESKWANLMGTIRNNKKQCLFYAVSTDTDGNWTNLKLFSSMDLNEDSFLVSYPWNDYNDNLIIETLNLHDFELIINDNIFGGLPFKK